MVRHVLVHAIWRWISPVVTTRSIQRGVRSPRMPKILRTSCLISSCDDTDGLPPSELHAAHSSCSEPLISALAAAAAIFLQTLEDFKARLKAPIGKVACDGRRLRPFVYACNQNWERDIVAPQSKVRFVGIRRHKRWHVAYATCMTAENPGGFAPFPTSICSSNALQLSSKLPSSKLGVRHWVAYTPCLRRAHHQLA